MIKKCFIDTETTGLFPEYTDQVHQISAIVTDDNLNPLDWINLKFSVSEEAMDGMPPEVFDKLNLTRNDIMSRKMGQDEGLAAFVSFCDSIVNKFDKKDKMQFIAYNAPFDLRFVEKLFLRDPNSYYGSYFWRPELCVYRQCAWLLQDKRDEFGHLGLGTMCEFAGVEFKEQDAHDALYDTKKLLELYKRIR